MEFKALDKLHFYLSHNAQRTQSDTCAIQPLSIFLLANFNVLTRTGHEPQPLNLRSQTLQPFTRAMGPRACSAREGLNIDIAEVSKGVAALRELGRQVM